MRRSAPVWRAECDSGAGPSIRGTGGLTDFLDHLLEACRSQALEVSARAMDVAPPVQVASGGVDERARSGPALAVGPAEEVLAFDDVEGLVLS